MTQLKKTYPLFIMALLLLLLHAQGMELSAQEPVKQLSTNDSISTVRQPPKARARRNRSMIPQVKDSVQTDTIIPNAMINDSLRMGKLQLTDSIHATNMAAAQNLEEPLIITQDSVTIDTENLNKKLFVPNPTRATWLAVVFPGAGQIYNRKYWKLPIIYGGFAGCAYAITWNNKMYKDYAQAYMDIMDSNPNTNSYEDLISSNSTYSEDYLKSVLKKRKDSFRRFRDLSIFVTIGVYILSIIDAYVDAELSNFDIGPDLSMQVSPTVIDSKNSWTNSQSLKNKSVGLQCKIQF